MLWICFSTNVVYIIAEVILHFTQQEYRINENEMMGFVCVEIANGTIERNVTFSIETLITSSSTAEGISIKKLFFCW